MVGRLLVEGCDVVVGGVVVVVGGFVVVSPDNKYKFNVKGD